MNEERVRQYRRSAAELARSIRAMWPDLRGDWTRRDWNNQALAAARNHLALMARREGNRGTR